jgi:mannose/fructose/N-acetylgalactosamine-specific phosphotransferase system component IIB
MGYLGNHLATVVTGVFAAILTGLWPYFVDFAPILNFVFTMAVPITWFLTFTCWISQKSIDYMHKSTTHVSHSEKKSLSNSQTTQIYTSDGKQVSLTEIKIAQNELSAELKNLKETVKLKDSEIERLNQEISNLHTLVQIESLKTELANLKMLASKSKNDK